MTFLERIRISTRTVMTMLVAAAPLFAQPTPFPALAPTHPLAAAPGMGVNFQARAARGTEAYRSGIRRIDERQYERAVENFDAVIKDKSPRADGALYWKAYALRRLGKNSEAVQALADLESGYPQSRWANDARALAVEIRQGAGAVSAEDEELKLLALNGLVQNDPESAVPLIEKVLSSAKNPPRMKQRALYVLAQSKNAKAREIVTQYARGGSNPDLQLTAIDYLGAMSTPEGRLALGEIYKSSSDAAVKRMALQGMARGRDKAQLLQIAKSETDADLKREALHHLANAGGVEELKEMFRSETDPATRLRLANILSDHLKVASLIELARAEKDPAVKKEMVRRLSDWRTKEAQAYLVELLQQE